jgi:hypothetical protein
VRISARRGEAEARTMVGWCGCCGWRRGALTAPER